MSSRNARTAPSSKSLSQTSPSQSSQSPSDLLARLANLEQSLQVLSEAHNANADAFSSCLYSLEARQWMLMKAVDDLASRLGAGESIPWDAYLEKYTNHVEEQRLFEENAKNKVDDPDAGAVVFGGK